MVRQNILGPLLRPTAPLLLIGIIFQVEAIVLFAATTKQVKVIGEIGIGRLQDRWLAQRVGPQVLVQLTIAEMIRVMQIRSQQGEPLDDFPQLRGKLGVVQLSGGGNDTPPLTSRSNGGTQSASSKATMRSQNASSISGGQSSDFSGTICPPVSWCARCFSFSIRLAWSSPTGFFAPRFAI